jgi:lipopolysaccharide/colanic/teichoic acid biosynthesis glycosyltransferase
MNLSRSSKPIGAILVPKVKEPWLKRPLDVTLSTLMLVLSAPVSLLIALSIKLEDRGPVFYRQERWGRGGSFQDFMGQGPLLKRFSTEETTVKN